MGLVGGALFHGAAGAINAPRAVKLKSAFLLIKEKAPVTGGTFILIYILHTYFNLNDIPTN